MKKVKVKVEVEEDSSTLTSTSTFSALVRQRLVESAAVKQALTEQADLIAEIAGLLIRSLKQGGKVLFFGNGGSAADAEHLAAELLGKFRLKRASLPALSLTTNISSLTAIGNDFSFRDIFVLQLEAFGRPGDVAIGLSTSGDSDNVVRALATARRKGLITVGLTGADGGKTGKVAEYCLRVPSRDTARIQEGQIAAGHIICEIVEAEMFG
jgi:D-sedoheptulose 7-phosphate isomerase